MASKAHLSDLPTPASKSPECQKKGSIEPKGQSKKAADKVDVMENSVEIEDIRSDPNCLNTLTVKQLHAMTRTVGISSRGNKQELVSALKRFCTNTENARTVEHVDPKRFPSKRKVQPSSLEDHAKDSSSVSDIKETKRRSRIKRELVECMAVEDGSLTVVKQKKCSSIVEEVIVEKNSRSNKSTSKQTLCVEVVASQTDLPLGSAETWTVLAHKKPQKDWIPYNPTTMRLPPLCRDTNFLKLMSWNVNGLRALLKLESFSVLQLAQKEDFDVICLQETKIQEKDVEEIKERLISGYDHSFWTCSVSKLGYSGTAIISRVKPISVKYGLGISDHDSEGRLVTMEFDTFFLLCGYVPNSGDGLRRLTYRVEEWDRSLSDYMKELEKSKPVVLTGDLNCAHQEIDIFNPAGNRRSAGFTIEERESFERNFLSRGFVDTFRKQHPGVVAYTYWGYRHGGRKANKGWRLDYFLVSESIAEKVYDSYILPEVGGSDHCPIGLILKL